MRIRRPSQRIWLTVLNDWDPPHTCNSALVSPRAGRTARLTENPGDSGFHDARCDVMPS